ncbi:hypothetical protein ACQKO5_03815 [Novosphingobium subterraneum]|uniref:hypothetical protein n=1 Tax=Novosphingobium subterraneum TaxID=48936 RepID=UPI003D03BD61
MAESLLIDAIRRADEISAIFEEDYRHFETSMKDSIPLEPVDPKALSDWEQIALDHCGLLHASWCRKIKDYAASKLGAHEGPLGQLTVDAAHKPTLPPTYPKKPGVRALDLD